MRLQDNPFFVLGASPRTRRDDLTDFAEERALLDEENSVRTALSTLTNPRRRLTAEVAWCPGVRPSALERCLNRGASPQSFRDASEGAPAVAACNLLAEGLFVATDAELVCDLLEQLTDTSEEIDVDDILEIVNEERMVAGIAPTTDLEAVDAEIAARREHWRRACSAALMNLTAADRVATLTKVLERNLDALGDEGVPALLHTVVDSYALDAEPFFEHETEQLGKVANWIRDAARAGDERRLNTLVPMFDRVTRNWDWVAQPIQLSTRARGLDHDRSLDTARMIRSLAIELFNEHDLLAISKQLTDLQREVFAELDGFSEKLDEDAETLDEIATSRERTAKKEAENQERWRQQIAFDAEFGLLSKNRLRLSESGVEWNGRALSLKQITVARWGATRHSINGIPTGTEHAIYLGGDGQRLHIGFRGKSEIFSEFVDKLFRAVGPRIIQTLAEGAAEGGVRIGSITVHDDGVDLERRSMFRGTERRRVTWSRLSTSKANGALYLACRDDPGFKASLNYQTDDNVHFFEVAMKMAQKAGRNSLSGAFR